MVVANTSIRFPWKGNASQRSSCISRISLSPTLTHKFLSRARAACLPQRDEFNERYFQSCRLLSRMPLLYPIKQEWNQAERDHDTSGITSCKSYHLGTRTNTSLSSNQYIQKVRRQRALLLRESSVKSSVLDGHTKLFNTPRSNKGRTVWKRITNTFMRNGSKVRYQTIVRKALLSLQ